MLLSSAWSARVVTARQARSSARVCRSSRNEKRSCSRCARRSTIRSCGAVRSRIRNWTPRSGREAPNCGARALASENPRVASPSVKPSWPSCAPNAMRWQRLQATIGRSRPELRADIRHNRACPGHPRRSEIGSREIGRVGSALPFRPHIGSGLYTTTWMTGTSPVMTIRRRHRCVEPHRNGRLRLFCASTPPRKSPIIAA